MSTPVTPVKKSPAKLSVFDFQVNTSERLIKGEADQDPNDNHLYRESGVSNAEGWTTLAKTMTEYDEVKIKDCKEDMDTLLVFAGLFSAVLTAFNIELYRALQVEPTQMTLFILTQMSQQLNSFTINSGFINSTQPFMITPPTFSPSLHAIQINILWFCSLVCSLVTASVAMLIKQWLREYQSQEHISPRSRSRIRYWRNRGLVQFRVLEIAAFLPVLLQLALALFFGGLCLFLLDLHPAVGWVVTAFIIVWFTLYISSTLAPAFSSRSPYKTPLLKEPLQSVQRRFHRWRNCRAFSSSQVESRDERLLSMDQSLDVPILVAADATLQDDDFLDKTIRVCLTESDGDQVDQCMSQIISNRTGLVLPNLSKIRVADLQRLSTAARASTVLIILDALDREINRREREKQKVEWLPWMRGFLICSGSALLPVYPAVTSGRNGLQHEQSLAGAMVIRLLSVNEDVARGAIEVLAYPSYQRLPSSYTIPQITNNQVMTNLIAGSRASMAANTVDPTQLCQVVLYLATHFHDDGLREEWYHLNKLLTELATAISERWTQVVDYADEARHTAQFCLDYSHKLNFKHRGVAGTDLLDVLGRLANANSAEP